MEPAFELPLLVKKPTLELSNNNGALPAIYHNLKPVRSAKQSEISIEACEDVTRSWRDKLRLRKYLRLNNPNDERPAFRGWRKAVIAATAMTGVTLLLNVTLAAFAFSKSVVHDGVGMIYRGDCGIVKRWDTALHLLINVLSTALLGASSFTMQCLSSPTRSEIDKAHQQGTSLDIGLTSVRNLFHVKVWKASLWTLLCLSTIPLHLL